VWQACIAENSGQVSRRQQVGGRSGAEATCVQGRRRQVAVKAGRCAAGGSAAAGNFLAVAGGSVVVKTQEVSAAGLQNAGNPRRHRSCLSRHEVPCPR